MLQNLLHRIPLFVSFLIITIISALILFAPLPFIGQIFPSISNVNDRIQLFLLILGVISILTNAIQIQNQTKADNFSSEYLNQPDIKIVAFGEKTYSGSKKFSMPVKCCHTNDCKNECDKDHWFDILNTGNIPAKNLKVALFCKDETGDIESEKYLKRWIESPALHKNDSIQYKLPSTEISLDKFSCNKNMAFVVVISYESHLSKIKYKGAYELFCSPQNGGELTSWENALNCYSLRIIKMVNQQDVSVKEIINHAIKKSCGKNNTLENWYLDF